MQKPIFSGQRVLVQCEFRLLGVPTDPTVVQCTVRTPQGSTSVRNFPSESFVRRDMGLFEASVTVDIGGTWWIRIEGVGVVDAVTEISFEVIQSVIT